MEQPLILVGIIAIFIGFALILLGSQSPTSDTNIRGEKSSEKKPIQVGVGGFIGPIPFGFANSREMLYLVIAVSVGMFLLSLYLSKTI